MFTDQVDQLDKLLDELEDLARSNLPSSRFFVTVAERLQLTMAAKSVAILLPASGGDWLPIARCGDVSHLVQADLSKRASAHEALTSDALMGCAGDETWFATPLRPRNFAKGCLLASTDGAVPKHAVAGLLELLAAFAEVVAMRQQAELESFLDDSWDNTQTLCHQINNSKSYAEATTLLASGLARTLGATRVTVMSTRWLGAPQIDAISSVPQVNSRTAVVQALQTVGHEIVRSGKPVLREQPYLRDTQGQLLPEITADGTFANLIGVRLSNTMGNTHNSAQSGSTLLTIEYQSYSEMVRWATKLSHLLPTVATAWEQHLRWMRLPGIVRLWMLGPLHALRSALPLVKWGLLVLVISLAAWVLGRPYPLVIEAEGSYEPVTSRAIYATDDGFVDKLLVDDGARVTSGQPLVQLRSPTLELRIEQTEGAARAVDEEAGGIRIAINQLTGDAPEVLSNQSRLAGKIAELEIRKNSLLQQLQLLHEQRARLLLLAPIDGSIVAKDLHRNLAARPVRRGDSLFNIVDQSGPWQVRVQVADRDAGYLLQHFTAADSRGSTESAGPASPRQADTQTQLQSTVEYCMASDPDERFAAQVAWIADHVENRHGEGCTLEVRATVGPSSTIHAHAGAGVHVFFECGQQPLWFVWCRPVVEAVQRRMWFSSPGED